MTKRQRIYQKYNGLCAYSGTPLEPDWQIDHVKPILRIGGKANLPQDDIESNMIPCQRAINKYKGSLSMDEFRNWYLGGLHLRLAKLPRKTRTVAGEKRKKFLLKIAHYFDISPEKPFSGIFYFEKVTHETLDA